LDKEIAALSLHNQQLYDQAATVEEKINIIRYELLYQFGGVVVDHFHTCFKDVGVLHHGYDFYAGMQPLDTGKVRLSDAILGASAKHPIVYECLKTLESEVHASLQLTQAFMRYAEMQGKTDVVFPSTYFDPQDEVKPETFAKKS
jgi:sucrose-6-phosphate hydrolase SacC (GH32 family)